MQILDNSLCSGCGACQQSCGKNAITMRPDQDGFFYPVVDEALCADCGLCKNACPVLNRRPQTARGTACGAMAAEDVRLNSSSGGVFTLMAEYILEQGGVVFGAAFDEALVLRHIGIESKADLPLLQGSKYVQSQIGDSYRQVRTLLKEGRPVLFTGTPCQINGLRGYLGRDHENLYCQDIICHGVPSPSLWARYVSYREQKAGSRAVSVSFRSKQTGWKGYHLRMEFENGQVYSCQAGQDPYMQSFLGDLCLRESCHSCGAKGEDHTADLTLGDFWGVEQLLPELYDNKGTSLVLVHTDKGQRLFDAVREKLKCCPADWEKAIAHNPAMVRSSPRSKNREKFLKAVAAGDFQKAANKYRPRHPIRALKAAVKKLLK